MTKNTLPPATDNKTARDWNNWLNDYNKKPRPLSTEEMLALRDAVITYESVAHIFFFETVKPMVSGLAYKIRQTYHTDVSPDDISTIIYREIWEEGRFTRLRIYRGEESLFSWVSRSAAQTVYADLEAQLVIKRNHQPTAKNTSLRLRSFAENDELTTVLDLVTVPQWHDILVAVYVNNLSNAEIMEAFHMNETTLAKTLKVAETALKENLIATESILWYRPATKKVVNLVKIALGDVSGHIDTTSTDEALSVALNQFNDSDLYEDLIDYLPLQDSGLCPEARWFQFVVKQAMASEMSTKQLNVWFSRFVFRENPVDTAARLGMQRSNVDNEFSRANKCLKRSLRNWWMNRNKSKTREKPTTIEIYKILYDYYMLSIP